MSAVFVLYLALKHRAQNVMLLAASYFFYGYWDWRFLGLLGGSTVVVYLSALAMGRAVSEQQRTIPLVAAVGTLLIVLGIFKYLNFFADSLAQVLALIGVDLGWNSLNVILPVGISFYTFQAIGYVIDVHQKRVQPVTDIVEFALFISFFPLLLSGPIERSTRLLPQIAQPRTVSLESFTRGAFLILFGLFKKVVIADGLSRSIDPVFAGHGGFGGLDVTVAIYLYVLQLYCDFSGYSDMARGVARVLGFNVMKNFMTPFYARSPSEYWTRWHIGLSSWVRDYIYLPLALHYLRRDESKLNEAKPHIYAMLLMGLWHGAAWTYILWGLYHGAMLVLWSVVSWPRALKRYAARVPPVFWVVVYFHITVLSLLIFRANSLEQIAQLAAMVVSPGDVELHVARPSIATALGTPLFLVMDWFAFRHRSERFYRSWPPALRGGLYLALSCLILMGLSNESTQFIYFQF
jgi:D-alanyl-lipoteichoic acid acyltransferase DltB (MBOAT superfamily)